MDAVRIGDGDAFRPTLPELIKAAARAHGERPFVVLEDEVLTFAGAERKSAAWARGLLAMGVGKGSRVGLLMPNSPDWAVAWFAAARTGALTTAMSTFYQPPELAWAVKHNDIETLLLASRYLKNDYLDKLERALPGLTDQTGPDLFLDSAPYLRRILVWGECDRPWAMRGPEALAQAAAARPQIDAAFLAKVEEAIAPPDPLITICTSGSTAEPKAVVHRHGVAVGAIPEFIPYYDWRADDRAYSGHPYFWIGGLNVNLLPALFMGDCQICSPSPAAEAVAAMVERHRVTRLAIWPAQAAGIREAAERDGRDLSSVRVGLGDPVDLDGEVIPADQRYGGVFGMTETFGMHSLEKLFEPVPWDKAGSHGRALPGLERRIVDRDTGEVLRPGEIGELQIRGHTLMVGYYKRPPSAAFTPDGYFATGDLCSLDDDGWMRFHGRIAEVIKTAGANVSPREVELALMAQGGLREAHVFGLPDALRGELVAAVLAPGIGEVVDIEGRMARLREELSPFKVPKRALAIPYEDIPRTLSGKVDKPALKARLLA